MVRLRSQILSFFGGLLAVGSHVSLGAEFFQLTSHQHGITGAPSATLTQGGYELSLLPSPAGSLLNETSSGGLGIDSSPIVRTENESPTRRSFFNLLGGGPSAGAGESATFSFNRPGILQSLHFDGVKDETFEHFRLNLPSGGVLTLMDYEVETRLQEQGFTLAAITLPGLTFLSDGNDDRLGLNIPFNAGDQFTLTYGEFPYPPGYAPRGGESPNGARWEGVVVSPEPASSVLALVASLLVACRHRRDSRRCKHQSNTP